MSDYHRDNSYPPGWDCKYDQNTGKCYYINYITKAMTIDDPRPRYRLLQNERASMESIPMQPVHGSPYHVYPANNYPAIQAFQAPSSGIQSVSASPLLTSRIHQMEMVNRYGSPVPSRILSNAGRSTIQETSFITPHETDAVVSKINTMFPTASDAHIRLLLKNEAVVISALQVEKHPITQPGPYSTPPMPRHTGTSNGSSSQLFNMTPPVSRMDRLSRTESPIPLRSMSRCSGSLYGSPRIGDFFQSSSPKPHSPKMKLRYMKSIYPKADEALILDVLANSDNNVQRASERLKRLGYEKRDMTAPKVNNRQPETPKKSESEVDESERVVPLKPKERTPDEKAKIKCELQEKYQNVAERIITMALESVEYSEEKASQILEIVLREDEVKNVDNSNGEEGNEDDEDKDKVDGSIQRQAKNSSTKLTSEQLVNDKMNKKRTAAITTSTSGIFGDKDSFINASKYSTKQLFDKTKESNNMLKITRTKSKADHAKVSVDTSILESVSKCDLTSVLKNTCANGTKHELAKGPNDEILLLDYMTWNGANPDNAKGRQGLNSGPNNSLLSKERNYKPKGTNSDLCKGPKSGLAKGSIYSQLSVPNVKCN